MLKQALILAAALATAGIAQAEPATYAIEPTHTYATFEIPHFGVSTLRGRFEKKEGSVTIDRAAKTGKLEVTFDMNGINTGAAGFDKHLKSADFFEVEKFGTAKFVADKFTFDGDKVAEVSGQLTLKGKTAPATLKATGFGCYQHPMLKREVCGGDFVTTIDRTQWGVDYGLAWGFPKDVRLVIQVEAVKQ